MNTNSYLLALKITFILAILVSAETYGAEDRCVATASETTSPLNRLTKLTAAGPTVVAVGHNIIAAKTNTGQWRITKFERPASFLFRDIVWDGRQYLVVYNGSGVLVSADGMTWTQRPNVFPQQPGGDETKVMNIAYGNSQYVASCYGFSPSRAWLAYSMDGQKWDIAKLPFPLLGNTNILWDGHKFLTGTGLTSTDGANWSPTNTGVAKEAPVGFKALAWNGESYIGVQSVGGIWRSTDGKAWTHQKAKLNAPHGFLSGVTWGQSQFAVVGSCGDILTSVNGQTWARRDSGTNMDLSDVAWTGKEFIAVGQARADKYSPKPSVGLILTSPNGIDWKRVPDEAFVQQ